MADDEFGDDYQRYLRERRLRRWIQIGLIVLVVAVLIAVAAYARHTQGL